MNCCKKDSVKVHTILYFLLYLLMMKISIKLISAFSRTVLYWIDPGRLVAEQDHENSGHQ